MRLEFLVLTATGALALGSAIPAGSAERRSSSDSSRASSLVSARSGALEAPETDQACLLAYVAARSDAARALDILRDCADRFPDSFQVRRTLGQKLGAAASTSQERAEA